MIMKKYIILLLFLVIGFIPYFGVIDIIGSQWLYLSILNILLLIFTFKSFNFSSFKAILNFKPILLYSFFILLCFISIFYSNNYTISLVDFSRIIVTFLSISILIFYFSFSELDLIKISSLISVVLFFEVLYSFYPLIDYLIDNDFNTIDFNSVPKALKGVAGNKNVMAANVAFKLPFVIYLIFNIKSYFKYIFSFIFFLSLLDVFLLSSRAVLISSSFVLLFFIFHFLRNFTFKSSGILIPFFLPIISIFTIIYYSSNIDSINLESKVSSISTSDTSTNQRLTLYENAIDYISKNPIVGCGLGNWKVESLPYWRSKLTGYTIPYHAHNDFLELTTEIGIIGGIFYLSIFLFILYISFLLVTKNKLSGIMLLSLFSVYFIDACLNFPLERALSQVNFILLIILSYFLYAKNKKLFL